MPTRLFSEPWVQPREILFSGQSGTHTLKEACTFASITMINISNKKKMHNQLTMPHESSNEGNSVNFLDMCQWLKQIRGQGFFTDILNASALSAWVLSYTVGTLTYSTLVLIPRNNTVMKHCPNAHTAFTELLYKTMHAFRGMEREWSRTDL